MTKLINNNITVSLIVLFCIVSAILFINADSINTLNWLLIILLSIFLYFLIKCSNKKYIKEFIPNKNYYNGNTENNNTENNDLGDEQYHHYDPFGFDILGYDKSGYDIKGYNRGGYDRNGYNEHGYDFYGYDLYGYDIYGYDCTGYDKEGNIIPSNDGILSNKQYKKKHVDFKGVDLREGVKNSLK
jgi:hypothetical protein